MCHTKKHKLNFKKSNNKNPTNKTIFLMICKILISSIKILINTEYKQNKHLATTSTPTIQKKKIYPVNRDSKKAVAGWGLERVEPSMNAQPSVCARKGQKRGDKRCFGCLSICTAQTSPSRLS